MGTPNRTSEGLKVTTENTNNAVLNYKERQAVMAAARAKKNICYEEQKVQFYSDLVTGLRQPRKNFDPIHQELHNLGIRHGVIHPTYPQAEDIESLTVNSTVLRIHLFQPPSNSKIMLFEDDICAIIFRVL